MGDHDITPTCLSAEEHGNEDISDKILHYLGCLEFCDREKYYVSLDREHQEQVDSELRRIDYLRQVLEKDKEDSILISNLRKSVRAWKECTLFKQDGIGAVRNWRSAKGRPNKQAQRSQQSPPSTSPTHEPYDPDRDLNAYHIRYVQSQPVTDLQEDQFNGHFPNHKIPVSLLLSQEKQSNPLARDSHLDQSINYFHFPANNMNWIERAIARYFSEKDITYDGIFRHPSDHQRTKTSTVLRPEFWKGQQHGGRSASVHARHLRPLCEIVSSDPNQVENAPRNIVLFMPYLHWETDRQREKLSRALDVESERHRNEKQNAEDKRKRERQHHREELVIPSLSIQGKDVNWKKPTQRSQSPIRRASTAMFKGSSHIRKDRSSKSPFRKKKGTILAGTEVGQVLLDAAVLYEAMANYRDRMFIQKYLHKDPPLHPRRTLDQAYYWTLKTTKLRDRDQVVYRGTTVNRDLRHKLQPKQQEGSSGWGTKLFSKQNKSARVDFEWNCEEQNIANRPVFPLESQSGQPKPPNSNSQEIIDNPCQHCRDHIRKVSRVVMVDQLWMWILDERTIITCFPKRYGVNKRDPSGVHKSIRSRLKGLRKDHIRTVFDLALIVLSECSNTFFDRTKTQDRQPQVMDIFSESIGNVNNRQTISFEHLWEWTGRVGSFAKPGYLPTNLSDFVIPLLNIKKEGELQREIKDIIDELDIMIYISTQQRDVMKKFKKEVTHILDPLGMWKDKLTTTPIAGTQGDGAKDADTKKRHDDYFWFVNTAEELLSDVDDQIGELEGLKKSAESTSTSLDHLLNLKQQQASVFQTWQSTKQAEETMRQGRAIIIFTVMTIIFLPLGFIASIFGMNNKQISGDEMPMTLRSQFRYMFSISTGIICFALVIAFSDYVRTVIWLLYKYLITVTVIKSGLYDRVYLSLDWKSRDLVRKVEDRVTKMKAEVKAARQKRVKAHSRHLDPAGEGSPGGDDTRDGGSGSGAAARLNSTATGAADGSAASGTRLRARPSQPGKEEPEGDAHHHVVHINDFGAATRTGAGIDISILGTNQLR